MIMGAAPSQCSSNIVGTIIIYKVNITSMLEMFMMCPEEKLYEYYLE